MLGLIEPFTAYLQKKALFRPVKLPEDYAFAFAHPFEEVFLDTADGARLNLLQFPSDLSIRRGVVLYFHGNRGNLQRWGNMHADFTSRGFDFVAPDYRGYGKSSGEPNERSYYADARLVYDWLHSAWPAHNIILYGRSLGTAMACYLAAHVRAKKLILETPFDNIAGLMASHLGRPDIPFRPAFFFPNDRHLRQCELPALLFHGTADRVVPYESAARLKSSLKPGDEFVTVQSGAHNNLRNFRQYQEKLNEWLDI
ncbi:MAG: alpha/beta hydrolase [Saprospirales bacterium]|nr:alpha/beta hydrolase [Saprospirales bacterium]MBK8923577.1 alpha/beta hydrolase [Saprospirales bacterium]